MGTGGCPSGTLLPLEDVMASTTPSKLIDVTTNREAVRDVVCEGIWIGMIRSSLLTSGTLPWDRAKMLHREQMQFSVGRRAQVWREVETVYRVADSVMDSLLKTAV